MMMSRAVPLTIVVAIFLLNLTGQCHGQLQFGFYKNKCSFDVESIVRNVVQIKYFNDTTLVAALLRMQFHDCFVHGCDASLLLDGDNSEKTAPPNLTVRGFEVIDAIKAAVEFFCPGIVSCADIIAIATREAVFLAKGGWYNVETGRRDGFISKAADVDLPAPNITVSDSIAAFAKRNLDATDMVYLLGGHTVGIAHCFLFQDRLYNYKNTNQPDPNMDLVLLNMLRDKCPQNSDGSNTTFLDQNPSSSFIVDSSYYQQLQQKKGILQIDQDLASDPNTKSTVENIGNGNSFSFNFGLAMIKLGAVDVLTVDQGEIRRSCRSVNKP
ncbi:peroxidase 60 [Mercurialis annua]|uniref:peroxidase 60 n=1 Tax=Mercurialis annua TaxID=3986 RepID=UPI00216054A3|nr:peroxidase 60 [Mercurialis annua]